MNVEQQDAQQTLSEIEQAADKARRRELYKGADVIYMVWGVAWVIGFVSQHFSGDWVIRFGSFAMHGSGWAWNLIVPIAIVATIIVSRRRSAVLTKGDKLVGPLFGLLFLYAFLAALLLRPVFNTDSLCTAEGERVMVACIILVPMLAYVVMGLFGYGLYMLWLGLAVTAANLFGMFVLPGWYYLWMALMGGGGLFAAGLITRRAWRNA